AAEARRTLPLMRDDNVTSFVQDTGRRLTSAIPAELRHPEFEYTFEAVNAKEITAFALPGAPMFVTRGMIGAARSVGEGGGGRARGVRHGHDGRCTARASRATECEVG